MRCAWQWAIFGAIVGHLWQAITKRDDTVKQSESAWGYVMVAMAATLWGTTGTSQALAPEGVTPLSIGTMRILGGGITLLILVMLRGGFQRGKVWHVPTVFFVALCAALYQVSFFGATAVTGVAVGTVVGIGSAPIFMGLLGRIFEGESLSKTWYTASGLAIVGVVLLGMGGDSLVQFNLLGVLLALGAGLSYSLFSLGNKRLLRHHRSDEVMAVVFLLGSLMLMPFFLMNDVSWIATRGGIVVVLHLGVIATGLSYVLFGRGLKRVNLSTAGTLTLMEPLTATLLGVLVVGEALTRLNGVGMILIFAGLAALSIVPFLRVRHRAEREA
jgi:DME family drug/metabolite transporter